MQCHIRIGIDFWTTHNPHILYKKYVPKQTHSSQTTLSLSLYHLNICFQLREKLYWGMQTLVVLIYIGTYRLVFITVMIYLKQYICWAELYPFVTFPSFDCFLVREIVICAFRIEAKFLVKSCLVGLGSTAVSGST